jgi:hypothetical protein
MSFRMSKEKPRSDLTSDKKRVLATGHTLRTSKKPLPWLVVRQNNNSWFSWSIRYRLAAGIVSTFSMHPWFRIYPGEIDKTDHAICGMVWLGWCQYCCDF